MRTIHVDWLIYCSIILFSDVYVFHFCCSLRLYQNLSISLCYIWVQFALLQMMLQKYSKLWLCLRVLCCLYYSCERIYPGIELVVLRFCTFSIWQCTAKCFLNWSYDFIPLPAINVNYLNSYQLSVVDLIFFLPVWSVWQNILIILMCVNIFPQDHVNWQFKFPFLVLVHILSPIYYMVGFLSQ